MKSDRFRFFAYFILIILTGSALLSISAAWNGPDRLPYIDALFTSTSAVCVTGLITVDTALYSPFGKAVILCLIQAGGLGIVTFTTIFLAFPRRKISLKNRKLIQDYALGSVEHKPRHIMRDIILSTVFFEGVGTLFLYFRLRSGGIQHPFTHALFHSVSAFCNAGFSLNSNNLEGYVNDGYVLTVIMSLIVIGGIGFVVIQDLFRKLIDRSHRITLHTKLVLTATLILIFSGALAFFILEQQGAFLGLSTGSAVLNAFFQSVTSRTAGFDSISQPNFTLPSVLLTIVLMFIGGSPGSTAGGVKTSTFFLVLFAILRGADEEGYLSLFGRKLPRTKVTAGVFLLLKAVFLLAIAVFFLSLTEARIASERQFLFRDILFECVSAFGTVGLSQNLTPFLSVAGKVVIILTMFAGRVGLVSMVMPNRRQKERKFFEYPEEEVLIG